MFWTSEIVTGVKSSNKVPSCGLSQEKLSPVNPVYRSSQVQCIN